MMTLSWPRTPSASVHTSRQVVDRFDISLETLTNLIFLAREEAANPEHVRLYMEQADMQLAIVRSAVESLSFVQN